VSTGLDFSGLDDEELLEHRSFRHRFRIRDTYYGGPVHVHEVEYDEFGRLSLFAAFCCVTGRLVCIYLLTILL